jgi:ribosomal protein S18 acetylase RimI-like enzyme
VFHRPFEERLAGWRSLLEAPDCGVARFALVLEDGTGTIAGLASGGPAREAMGEWTGHVYQLYLRGDLRGRGLGRRLLGEAAVRLRAAGHRRHYLWTPGANAPARAFYERCGGRLLKEESIPRFPGVTRVAYGFEASVS